jgi:D-3-phosphoglycerate dehydrogenase
MLGLSYRILLTDADRFPLSVVDRAAIQAMGAELIEIPYGMNEDQMVDLCREVDAVLLFSPKITARVIDAMNCCQIIARCGIGYDNIDVQAARRKGITVTYVPDYCIEEVSDHTLALMFDCWRKISFSSERVKMGLWDSYEELGKMRRISGQYLGFLGFGRIAQNLARKLQGFGLQMITYDPHIEAATAKSLGVGMVSFQELVSRSDVISLHVPLAPDTQHIINRDVLAQMKQGVIIINTSRGKLIDEAALNLALISGQVAAAGLDVLEEEPASNLDLLKHMRVVVTPHSAAFSEQALEEVKQRAIEEIARKFKGLKPLLAVPIY